VYAHHRTAAVLTPGSHPDYHSALAMADSHGSHGSHGAQGAPHHHSLEEPAEDALRTPGWLPLLGFGLLMAGALGIYLFISPGVMNATPATDGDAAVGDASTH